VGLATDWGRMLPCFALLQGNASETGEHLRGDWSSNFQLIPVSHPLFPAREREGWAWLALEGMPGGLCRQWAFISSLSVAALKRLEKGTDPSVRCVASQTIHILPSARQQPTWRRTLRALCCWPCKARERPGSPGRNGCLGLKTDPQAQSPGVLRTGSNRAEQTGSFLASPTACRTSHPSAHPGRHLV